MRKIRFKPMLMGLALIAASNAAVPCSNTLLTGAPNSNIVVSARTMDFNFDLLSQFVLVPRNMKWTSDAPVGQKPGVSWENRYGFVGINILDKNTNYADGINEAGLSAALLWLGEAKYPEYPSEGGGLSLNDIVSYILGQFSTVEDAKWALENITVWAPVAQEIRMVPPMHLVVMDASGKSFVVEWTKGVQNIYDNSSIKNYQTVLTNSPVYPKQLQKFQRFAKLPCLERRNYTMGLTPLPGNSDSDARFVRLAKLSTCVQNDNNDPYRFLIKSVDEGIERAFQTIGRVETVWGEDIARETPPLMPYRTMYWTQWSLVRVHGHMDKDGKSTSKLLVRSSGNQSIRILDLASIDFDTLPSSIEKLKTIPIENPENSRGEVINFQN